MDIAEDGFVHRDIKPENILLRISEDKVVSRAKICGFGASKELRSTTIQRSLMGSAENQFTPSFAPPEEFQGAYELWGYGLILCFLDGDSRRQPQVNPMTIAYLARDGTLL